MSKAFEWYHFQLEGHSVERIYLQQRSSDGSVNKTILKPRLTLATRHQYVYVGFNRRKIPHSSAARWQEKLQSCVAYTISQKTVRFRPPDSDTDRAQKLIRLSMSQHLSTRNISSKSMHVFLNNLANRQTDKHKQKHVPPPLSEVMILNDP